MNKTTATCQICGNEFATLKSEIRRGKGKYCSLSCTGKAGAKEYAARYDKLKDHNPNWRGGITPEHNKTLYSQDQLVAWQKIQTEINSGRMLRQPCEICGSSKTDAHHDDYSKPTEIRWLCRSHHLYLHH
jgi:hypothetical protein